MRQIFSFIALLILLLSCSDNTTNPESNLFKVSGKLVYNNKPLENATISLNDVLNYTTSSGINGDFQISEVPMGKYNFKVQKTFENGSFLSKTSSLEVNNDINLNSLLLPKGITIYPAKNITSSSASISWSSSNANDFREYKLYRHTSSGIDETTGTLVTVSTSLIDTVFTDTKLEPIKDYYYRIYVMNEFGKLGGSNVVKIKTQNTNLIQNGDFEELGSDNLPTKWNFRDNKDIFKIISSNQAESGNNYLQINPTRYVYDLSWGSLQYRVPFTSLISGSQYTLSFWYYIDELVGNSELFIEFDQEQSTFIWDTITNKPKGSWLKYERTFTAPLNISSDLFLRFEVRVNIPYNHELWKVRIDNVSLSKIQ